MNSKNDDGSHQGSGSNPLLSLGQDHALSYQQLDGSDVNQFGQSGSGGQSSSSQRGGQQYQQYQQYQQQQGGAQGAGQQSQPQQQGSSGQQPQPLYFQSHPSQGGQANQYGQSAPHDFNYMQANGSSGSGNAGSASSASGNQASGSNGSGNAASAAGNNPNFNQQQFSDLMYNSFLTQLSQNKQPQSSQSINQQQLNMNPGAAGSNAGFMNPSMQRYYQNNLSGYPSMIDGQNQSMLQPSHQIQSQSGSQQQLHQQMQPQQQASVQFQQQQAIQQAQMQAQQHPGSRSHHATKGTKGQRGNNGQGNANQHGAGGAMAGHAGEGAAGGKGAKGANGPKKLSTTQSRIEKRKQLKKQGPKRPSSAYFLFSMSIRNELLQQYPDAKVPELSKLASAKWKELTNEEKKPFYDEFRVNWEKYRVLRDEYEKTLPPKRPSGPFIQFTQEVRPIIVKENPDKNLIEITKLIGERWRNLNPVEKTKYTDAYKQKLKEWEKFYPAEELLKLDEQKSHRKSSKKHAKNANHANANLNAHNPNEMNLNLMGSPSGHPTDLDGSGAPQTINPASTDVNSLANGMIKNE